MTYACSIIKTKNHNTYIDCMMHDIYIVNVCMYVYIIYNKYKCPYTIQ